MYVFHFYTEKTSILMDHDSARYAVEGALGSRMCVSQQGLATVLYSSTHASVAVLYTDYLSTGKLYSQWSLKDAQTRTVAYTATLQATSTRYVKCNGWWCNFRVRATPTSFLFVPCGLSSVLTHLCKCMSNITVVRLTVQFSCRFVRLPLSPSKRPFLTTK